MILFGETGPLAPNGLDRMLSWTKLLEEQTFIWFNSPLTEVDTDFKQLCVCRVQIFSSFCGVGAKDEGKN